MNFVDRYIDPDYSSYEDFHKNCKIRVPEDFNFAYDIVDEYARLEPGKLALLWTNDADEVRRFTFADIKRLSDKAANLFLSLGLKKGDAVMTLLKRRWQYWIVNVALCKIGVVLIPATHLLTEKDIVYRVQAANIKAILSVNEPAVISAVNTAAPHCPTLDHLLAWMGNWRAGRTSPP